MMDVFTMSLSLMADSSGAISAMRDYVAPTMTTLTAIAALASVFFIVYGGILYMTSTGRPEKLDQAKRVLKNALIGVVIVLGAATLTAILNGAMTHTQAPSSAVLPNLEAIEPKAPSTGLIDILINAIVGLLNVIIQAIATPFLDALDFFTKSTPLMTDNPSVFNFWLAMVGITDVLFVVVVALIGFHVMSASTFGLDEIDFKHLLPRIALIFLLLNTSIFIIDGFIAASNALIAAVGQVGGASSVWDTLTTIFNEAGAQSVAALLIMLVFLIFSFILVAMSPASASFFAVLFGLVLFLGVAFMLTSTRGLRPSDVLAMVLLLPFYPLYLLGDALVTLVKIVSHLVVKGWRRLRPLLPPAPQSGTR